MITSQPTQISMKSVPLDLWPSGRSIRKGLPRSRAPLLLSLGCDQLRRIILSQSIKTCSASLESEEAWEKPLSAIVTAIFSPPTPRSSLPGFKSLDLVGLQFRSRCFIHRRRRQSLSLPSQLERRDGRTLRSGFFIALSIAVTAAASSARRLFSRRRFNSSNVR